MKKKEKNLIKDDRAIPKVQEQTPLRVPPRLEGVVKNAGIKPKRKSPKPRAK